MKAQNVHNPASVAGRGGDTKVSVGLQLQQSPRELTEKKIQELEHRVKKMHVRIRTVNLLLYYAFFVLCM